MDVLRVDLSKLHADMLVKLATLTGTVRDDDFYGAADAAAELDDVMDRWADIGDELNYRDGYAFLSNSPGLRDKLMAWGRETFDRPQDATEAAEDRS
jgi:hypothetical protein